MQRVEIIKSVPQVLGEQALFEKDQAEWNVAPIAAFAISVLPLALISSVTITAALALANGGADRALFNWITAEDSLLEWQQFVFVLAASLLFACVSMKLIRRGHWGIGLLYAFVALGTFFCAGEEISWGQRIFGLGTPTALETINHQGELNVHNIKPVQRAFGFVVLFAGAYGTLLPIFKERAVEFMKNWAWAPLLVPPFCLVPAFFMPFAYRAFRVLVWPTPTPIVVNFGEAPELCLYFGTMLFAWFTLRRVSREVNY